MRNLLDNFFKGKQRTDPNILGNIVSAYLFCCFCEKQVPTTSNEVENQPVCVINQFRGTCRNMCNAVFLQPVSMAVWPTWLRTISFQCYPYLAKDWISQPKSTARIIGEEFCCYMDQLMTIQANHLFLKVTFLVIQ